MYNDPIVEEIRKARQAHAARFGYDFAKIYKDLKDSEQRSGRKVVSLAGSERMRKRKEKARQPDFSEQEGISVKRLNIPAREARNSR